MAYYDAEGNEVQAVSADEVKALQEQKDQELAKMQEALKAHEEELTKLRGKDLNFSNLRTQQQEAEKKAEALRAEIDQKVVQAKKEVLEGFLADHYTEALESLAGGDEELKKKLEYHYKRLSDDATSKSSIDKKLRDAWALSQDRPSMTSNAFATSSSAVIRPSATSQKFSDEEKAFAKQLAAAGGLNLTDDDFAK
jgi:leucyl aminopeptidase (aminopeptidase T)